MAIIPRLDDWLRLTGKGIGHRRSKKLQQIDSALQTYNATRTPKALQSLDEALREYKCSKHGWFTSTRNRHRAISELSAAVSDRLEPTSLYQDYIWCPGIDTEMQATGANMIKNLKLDSTLHTAGSDLSKFSAKARLYILAHGHAKMPLFSTTAGNWTADQVASMLLDCGLRSEIRHITMLVCHAGESVNTVENAKALLEIQSRFTAAKEAKNQALMDQLTAAYSQASKSASAPRFYERADNSTEAIAQQSKQLLPMAAQLSAAMKKLGFAYFMLESYKAPVNQSSDPVTYFSGRATDAGIRLDLTDKRDTDPELKRLWEAGDHVAVLYALAREHPQYKAVWR